MFRWKYLWHFGEKVQNDEKLFADEHDVDIIGYGGASDDDHSSVRRCLFLLFLFFVTFSYFMSHFLILCLIFIFYVTFSYFMSHFLILCYIFLFYVTFVLKPIRWLEIEKSNFQWDVKCKRWWCGDYYLAPSQHCRPPPLGSFFLGSEGVGGMAWGFPGTTLPSYRTCLGAPWCIMGSINILKECHRGGMSLRVNNKWNE